VLLLELLEDVLALLFQLDALLLEEAHVGLDLVDLLLQELDLVVELVDEVEQSVVLVLNLHRVSQRFNNFLIIFFL